MRALADGPADATSLAHRTNLAPALATRLLDVLVALGVAGRDGERYVAAPGAEQIAADRGASQRLSAELRTNLLQAADLAERARGGSAVTLEGWHHENPEILRTEGVLSASAVPLLAHDLAPSLDDLGDRLQRPGAVALDVGTGVAAVAIGLARQFPALKIVGLEPAAAPMAEARRNVISAGLEDRIELRAQRVEELADEEAFDFAFLPIVFLPTDTVRSGLAAVHRALRPGGWVMMGSLGVPGDGIGPALARMKATLWGSAALAPEAVGRLAEDVGYDEVRFFPRPDAQIIPIVARRG